MLITAKIKDIKQLFDLSSIIFKIPAMEQSQNSSRIPYLDRFNLATDKENLFEAKHI